jgi:hypothetical protein
MNSANREVVAFEEGVNMMDQQYWLEKSDEVMEGNPIISCSAGKGRPG